ncbi:hypothetical protein KAR91_20195 [Candidatus Pacearchaeota archaeon]|nr:hypothetical protein [Candidatus Pacearchaeota archaeon]
MAYRISPLEPIVKHADEVLFCSADFAGKLPTNVTLSSGAAIESTLDVDTPAISGTLVTFWIRASGTNKTDHTVTASVVDSQGQTLKVPGIALIRNGGVN